VNIFEPLTNEEIERLNQQLPSFHLERGEIFYNPEEHSERLFVLEAGRVRIFRATPEGRELTLAVVESGTVFGEMALTAQRLQGAYAQAMEPSEVSVMYRQDLERLMLEKPEVGLRIVHLLSERLKRYETRLEDVILKGIPARLAGVILQLAESEGVMTGQGLVKIPSHYTHQQLGTMVGANREGVTRAFGILQDQGVVELKRRLIYVTDTRALGEAAGYGGVQEEEPTP
jgi:CRP-like cAMP-binding protein